jgi:hypothetical protein
MGEQTHTLKSGKQVVLSDWQGLEPPDHGKALLSRDWDPDASRIGLKFYKATEEYMRNEWGAQHMHPTMGKVDGEPVLLYYHQQSDSWHTADALDIDHVTQWKDHLKNLQVGNMAEAQMAYNDVSNLRLLPAAINRARNAAENVVETHGLDSPQWAKWCQQRFGFDPNADRPEFDPEKDAAKRRPSTLEAEWTAKHTRKDLGFDARVEGKWFEHELGKALAGVAVVERPVPPGGPMEVPLFRCAASGQLCTRDAFDIDHQIAFETLLKVLPDHTLDGKLTKADVLDAYNETSNLRLVSRSANSSHEWELTEMGEYRDAEMEAPEKPREFRGFLVDGAMTPTEQRILQEAIVEFTARQHYKLEVWGDLKDKGIIDFKDPRAAQGVVTQLSDPSHPDHGAFAKVMQKIDELDPKREVLPTQEHRDNLAAALVMEARKGGLPDIQEVAKGGQDGELLFAVHGLQTGNPSHVHVAVTVGAMTPMAYSTAMDDHLRQQQAQQVVPPSQQQSHSYQM